MPSIIERPVGALHTAHLDPMTGMGLLVLPSPADDVWFGGSLNGADWNRAMCSLDALGWEPLLDDDDVLLVDWRTRQGRRPVAALIAREPVVEDPSERQIVGSYAALVAAADVV